MLPYSLKLKPRSQVLRKYATPQENKLWYEFLRKHHLPWARQKPIGHYIVDFLCSSKKLVLEIDGSQHYEDNQKKYDNLRTDFLNGLGLTVMRFANSEVDKSFDGVCVKIQDYLDSH